MRLLLKRIAKRETYTIGKLYINGEYFCDTIEDKDRGLTQSTPISQIERVKVKNQTAVPSGTYKVTLDITSNKFGTRAFYQKYANKGKLPRLLNVPGFDGILMHVGNTALDSSGCIIVGRNTQVGKVLRSKETFIKLYRLLYKDRNNLYITIE